MKKLKGLKQYQIQNAALSKKLFVLQNPVQKSINKKCVKMLRKL